MTARSAPETPAGAVRNIALARVDEHETRASRLLRDAPLPAGMRTEIARAAHEALEQILPASARPSVLLSDGARLLRMAASDVEARVEPEGRSVGFEILRGRTGARLVRTGDAGVTRNGWPLAAARPVSLLDGDTVVSRGAAWVARCEGGRARSLVDVGPARRAARPPATPFRYSFSLEPHGEPVVLCLDAATGRAVVDAALGGDGSLPFDPTAVGELDVGLAGWVAHRAAARGAEALFGGRAALEPSDAAGADPALWLAAPVRVGSYVGAAWVGATDGAVRAASELLAAETRRARFASPAVSRVEVWVAARVPLGDLTPGELAAVEPGDTFVCRAARSALGPGLRGDGLLTVRGAEPAAVRVALEQTGSVLRARVLNASAEVKGGDAMLAKEDEPSEPGDEPRPFEHVLDALAVGVSVEVARRRMSLGELLSLSPGDVVELNAPVAAAVTLTIDGVPFARGELVDVEGALGVRVLAIGSGR